ncbi:hypothetical protein NMK71_01270 [Weeksellaceae bacterium KMM 9713]|uniref:Uncharacterized protein n=1 Tax=Profundicola chukchiensis TaxID=2961959 RepID=A0A9X4MYB2_9FLAO|nr:hypothetical protein [Profundicola chukchiensis]MDG4945032.1 hypothetical protein [Profundicola chukchiensis]
MEVNLKQGIYSKISDAFYDTKHATAIEWKSFCWHGATKNEVEEWRACTNSFYEIFCRHANKRLEGKRGLFDCFSDVKFQKMR